MLHVVVAGGPTKSRDKYPDKRNISNSVCANRALCVNREQHHCFPLKRFGNKVVLVDKTKRGSTVKHESVWPLSSPPTPYNPSLCASAGELQSAQPRVRAQFGARKVFLTDHAGGVEGGVATRPPRMRGG